MCVMPWVMNMEVKNVVVDVVDNDRSTLSQQLVHEIAANNYFSFHGQQPSYIAALNDIEHSEADIVVVIPQHYSRDLTLGNKPQVLIAANAVNGTKFYHYVVRNIVLYGNGHNIRSFLCHITDLHARNIDLRFP